jgi:hypothetical protein
VIGVGKAFIDVAIAVVVDAVTNFDGRVIDRRVHRRAISRVRITVIVVIGVASITDAVVIEVRLIGVGGSRTVVVRVSDAVTIRIGTTRSVDLRS